MEFYEILSNRRKDVGMSYDDLSARSSVPISTLKKILTGVTKDPQFETVRAVTYALGLTLNDLDDNDPSSIGALSSDESNLVLTFRKLNNEGKTSLLRQASYIYSDPDMKKAGASNTTTA